MHHALIVAALVGLAQPAEKLDPAGVEFFESRIRPLLVQHCYGCHSTASGKSKGELLLDSRDGVRKGGASGPAIVPGEPGRSLLVRAVHYGDEKLRMPPKGKLTQGEISDLEAWIKKGAPDPRDGKGTGGPIDLVKGREFWSFRPVVVSPPPAVKDTTWPLNDVDRFILATLEQRGLKPVAPAPPRVLLRRLTYDLTGLPPTPEELAAFEQSAIRNPQSAIEQVVERLLASPAYGERWGRHWLDVVRYADTAGDNSDYPIPQLYRYRNWVIDAFNHDLPYDRFITEQLAGDLLPGGTEAERRDRLIATGYLANTRRFGSYEDARYPWHLTYDDTIDNLGRTFLGLTINCARCHDHKFDPIPQEDYYALFGFFQSTRYPWPGIELDKVQRDLVPLASPEKVAAWEKDRREHLSTLDEVVKKAESDKNADAIKKAKAERDDFARKPAPFEMLYAVAEGPTQGKKKVGNACVLTKGDPDHPGKEVPRRFPLILGGKTLSPDTPGSGRLALADWIIDPANPLTARVMVNRIWQGHFGTGLVPTPSDFGKQGRPPTHPELLDYLAAKFIASGWSIKSMHRLIVLSRTYQLSCSDDESGTRIDVANDYHWRFARHRLDAESIRDTLLAVSGALDRSPGGPHPFPDPKGWNFTQHAPFKAVYETNRRSVYLMTQRIQRHPFLALFDGPDTNASTASRVVSTTPLQALFLMNDPFVHEQARKFAARLLADAPDDPRRIDRAFTLAFARLPTDNEKAAILEHLSRVKEKAGGSPAKAWESAARALFLSNEFVYVD
jgi:hypothetical protein